MNQPEKEKTQSKQNANPELDSIVVSGPETKDIHGSEEENEKLDWTKKEMEEAQPMPMPEITAPETKDIHGSEEENEKLDWTKKEMEEAQPMPMPKTPVEKMENEEE